MKIKNNVLSYLILFIFCAFVLVLLNFLSISALLYSQKDIDFVHQNEIRREIEEGNGNIALSQNTKREIIKNNIFVMLLDEDGKIILRENLPKELNKTYTLKDVANFSRYYLEDYPVRTYIENKGLLVIGQEKGSLWKYNLVYRTDLAQRLISLIPLFIVVNISILIFFPLWIQKRLLRKKEVERTEWIAGVSHDIRTPLTLIMGHADQIRKEPQSISNREKAELIEKQGDRIRHLVTNLNLSSKLDFGMNQFEKTEFKVSTKLRKIIVNLLNIEFNEKYQFDLEIEKSVKDLYITTNEDLFERMIENLIYNAIRHNPQGCEIKIRLKQSKDKRHNGMIEISDDGKGVSEEKLRELNRNSKNDLWNNHEHGIGLKIVHQIIKYNHWKIHFENRTTGGLKIRIDFS